MDRFLNRIQQFLRELRRRRVIRVVVVYAGIAFVILQLGEILVEPFGLGSWTLRLLTLLLILGFPLAVALAWIYDLTSEGIVREEGKEKPQERPGEEMLGEEASPEVVVGRASVLSSAVIIVLLSLGLGGAWWFSGGLTGEEEPGGDAGNGDGATEQNFDPARVAVLYFDDNSPGDTLTAFTDGFTEHLIHRLAQVEGLDVVSRHAVKPYRTGNVPLDSIARHLRAGSIVEGSVRAAGEDLVVTAQLIEGETQSHLTSEVVRWPAKEIFSLQDTLAREVSGFLRERLGRQVQLESWQAGTGRPKAWRLVQRASRLREDAEQLQQEGDRKTAATLLSQADSLLAEAESIDPDWSAPDVFRARLAETRLPPPYRMVQWSERELQIYQEGIKRAEEALERDSSNAEARRIRGRLRFWRSRQVEDQERAEELMGQGEEDLRRATRQDPGSARAWYALSELLLIGRAEFERARYYAKRAQRADAYLRLPADIQYQFFYASINASNFEDAAHWCQRGQNQFPELVRFRNCELVLLATEGALEPDIDRAWELSEEIQARANPKNQERFKAFSLPKIAAVLVRAGKRDSARAVLQQARRDSLTAERYPFVAYQNAHTYLLFGEEERALDLLSSFLDKAPHYTDVVAKDIWFEPLRDRPRFQELVGR